MVRPPAQHRDRTLPRSLVPALLTACLLVGALSRARAEAPAELSAGAAAHFEKGVELYREANLNAALVEFERAYELIPSYRLLYNLAQIQAERHEYAAAVTLFEKYLATGGDEIPVERRSEVEEAIAKLRARVAYLLVSSNVEGAQLFLNDQALAKLPLAEPIAVNAGMCDLRLEKAGYATTTLRLKVAGGERPRVDMPLVAAGRAPYDEASARSEETKSYLPFWISTASTLALGGATLGFGLTARAADRDLDAALAQVPADTSEVEDARSRVKLYAALTDACAIASLAGLGVALYFLIDPPKRAASPKEPARASLRLSPSTRGLGLRATF